MFRSTGSAEGGGGGDEDLWVWDSRSKMRTVGLVGLRICGRRWVVGGLLFVGLLEDL